MYIHVHMAMYMYTFSSMSMCTTRSRIMSVTGPLCVAGPAQVLGGEQHLVFDSVLCIYRVGKCTEE
jgi:hypothetical protein